ncbi:hypothetical protein [Mycolicibacterium sp. OfavD-34-C]|uniref:hypothetical protein n=1 Tax=Mycolicibacterium sp. OfavD-34-C TaxID=2917746 RepID=UPI001269006D|nr:hypothetical protein [Mycolicibacterium sp. OfavD-34-C]MCG7581013.1 hypothetical protein [Mycolicibacterium sp. OfavD-34-C]
MSGIVLLGVGVLVALSGVLFALQGFGFVGGSPMTGTTTWSVAGPIIAVAGVGMMYTGWRISRRNQSSP